MPGLTTSQIAFCAMIFGAGAMTPTVVKKVSHKPKPAAQKVVKRVPARVAQAPAPAPAKPSNILDCPTQAPVLNPQVVGFDAPPNFVTWPGGAYFPPGGPGGGGGGGIPAIPEPDQWVMLVLGFGFVGLSLRRRKAHA
jgi:hypothetical protein